MGAMRTLIAMVAFAGAAQAEVISDRVLLAGYCQGVLQIEIPSTEKLNADMRDIVAKADKGGPPSCPQCDAQMQRGLNELREQLRRIIAYVTGATLQLPMGANSTTVAYTQILAAKNNGIYDARECLAIFKQSMPTSNPGESGERFQQRLNRHQDEMDKEPACARVHRCTDPNLLPY